MDAIPRSLTTTKGVRYASNRKDPNQVRADSARAPHGHDGLRAQHDASASLWQETRGADSDVAPCKEGSTLQGFAAEEGCATCGAGYPYKDLQMGFDRGHYHCFASD